MNRNGCQDGAAIRRLRKARGYDSVKAFAMVVGITPQSLSNIELGNKPAGLAVLIRISREFGVPVDRILRADDDEADDAAQDAA
jgi:transcriptional regulator with XRE-family HTH domain